MRRLSGGSDYQRRRPAATCCVSRTIRSAATYYFRRRITHFRRLPAGWRQPCCFTHPDGGGVLCREVKSEPPASRSCQAYCMICISNRGLAGGVSSHHCWPSTGRGDRRGASRVGAGIMAAAPGRARPQAGAAAHDVHAGNIIHNESGPKPIDWEYAGDGDIALSWPADHARRRW